MLKIGKNAKMSYFLKESSRPPKDETLRASRRDGGANHFKKEEVPAERDFV
jgi:hypothetical protein